MLHIRTYIIRALIAIGSLILIALCVFVIFSTSYLVKNIIGIQATLTQQQKVLTTLSNIPANQSSVADANPGFVTIQPKISATDPSMGSASAPVTMVEFADFQCPFCQKFFQDSESDIISKYVDTGKVRFVFENFAFLGNESESAAEAASCANVQGEFWPYHDYLYTHQSPENSGALTIAALEHIAATIPDINTSNFNSCLSAGDEKASVKLQLTNAANEGIFSTPTILINGKEYVGVYDTATYENAIDAALASK